MRTRFLLFMLAVGVLVGMTTTAAQQRVICVSGCSGGGAVTNAGTFVVQENGAALTALQSIDGNIDTIATNLGADATHGNNVIATGPGITGEAKDIDGSALPNAVTEGQAVRFAATLNGAMLTTMVAEDGLSSPIVNEDVASAAADALVRIAAIRDDTLDARSATEGDYEMLHLNAAGALWTLDVNSAAALTALQLIDNAETAASHYAYTSAGATEDEHVVVAAPAVLWSVTATNHAAAGAYLRCENQDEVGDGAPGTDTLAAATDIDLEIPGNAAGAGITFSFARGLSFSVGIKCWITTGEAYSSVAEVGADDVKLLYSYK